MAGAHLGGAGGVVHSVSPAGDELVCNTTAHALGDGEYVWMDLTGDARAAIACPSTRT